MEPPAKRKSRAEFEKEIQAHLEAKCMQIDGTWHCKECKAKIHSSTCYVSVHTLLFDACAGGGEVEQKVIPYCPTCEGEPKENMSCIHE